MGVDTLRRLMAERKWVLAEALADDLFHVGAFADSESAYVAYALARSRSNQDKYSTALEPGQVGAYLARQSQDFDLFGRCLLELAYIESRIPGQEQEAVHTYHQFLDHRQHYSDDVRFTIPDALFNLAVVERNCGKASDAMQHFREAVESARRVGTTPERIEVYTRNLRWQALQVGDLALSESLIRDGEAYCKRHPEAKTARVHLLNDKAWYAVSTGNHDLAVPLILEAITLGDSIDDSSALAQSVLIWSRICEKEGNLDGAMGLGIWAHIEAQRSQRPELVAEVQKVLRGIRIQDRETVVRSMTPMLRPA